MSLWYELLFIFGGIIYAWIIIKMSDKMRKIDPEKTGPLSQFSRDIEDARTEVLSLKSVLQDQLNFIDEEERKENKGTPSKADMND